MTAPSDKPSDAPRNGLSAPESHEPPLVGTEQRPGTGSGAQTVAQRLADPELSQAAVWHLLPGVANWMPPDPCRHPDDRVLGPCDCRA